MLNLYIPALADVGGPPDGFNQWMACFMYVIVSLTAIIALINQFRRKPPVEVEMQNFATKESVTRIEVKIPTLVTHEELQQVSDKITDELGNAVRHLDQTRRVSIANLHDQLKSAEVSLAAVKTQTEMNTQQTTLIHSKVDKILERLPRQK